MQYIKGIENYHNKNRTVITLGKFDGLHQGHELLMERVIFHQKEDDVDGVVFAFDMKPRYERRNKTYEHIMTSEEKVKRLDGRIDYFLDCPFVDSISSMDGKTFIKKILVDKFHVKYIVVGSDFRFGYKRSGDVELLQKYSACYDYQVEVIEKIKFQGRDISSTYIRDELKKGNISLVDMLLGYSYSEMKKLIDTD